VRVHSFCNLLRVGICGLGPKNIAIVVCNRLVMLLMLTWSLSPAIINNEAHTFGYTCRDGTLKLYATHVIEPPKPERNSQGYFQRQLMLLLMAQLELRFQATGISFAGHRRGAAKRGGVMHHSEVLFLAL
jgi:hypothetical protein